LIERAGTVFLFLALGVAAAVGFTSDNYYLTVVLGALLFGLFASAADISIGLTGVLSLGSALFFGVGAYAVAVAQRMGLGFSVGMLMAVGIGAAAALALGAVVLTSRRSAIQFALLTLIASLTCEQVIVNYDLLGRSNGLPGLSLPQFAGSAIDLRTYYFICIVAIFTLLGGLRWLTRSRMGHLLRLVRDEPEKAESFGYDVKKIKIAATIASAVLSSACGGAYVVVIGIAFPGMFSVLPNMLVLVWIALGGSGTLLGPFFAAVAIKLIEFQIGRTYTASYMLIVGIAFVLAVAFVPGGLWTLDRQWRARQ
jgi:ABC-type branched-subunit amino acid transport system permease subunit